MKLNNIRPGTYRRRIIKIKKPAWNFEADVVMLYPYDGISSFVRGLPFSEFRILGKEETPDGTYFRLSINISGLSRAEVEKKILSFPYVERVRSLKLLGREGSAR